MGRVFLRMAGNFLCYHVARLLSATRLFLKTLIRLRGQQLDSRGFVCAIVSFFGICIALRTYLARDPWRRGIHGVLLGASPDSRSTSGAPAFDPSRAGELGG